MTEHAVIIGAGQAGAALAERLRTNGFEGRITLFGAEPVEPYQRPPLSKKYLTGEWPADRLALRAPDHWAAKTIELVTSATVSAVDLAARTLTVDGRMLAWTKLAFATGSGPRPLPEPFRNRTNVHELRTLADAERLKSELAPGRRLLVLGGGYVGLETAAVAARAGMEVVVVERAHRILERVACARTADILRAVHVRNGVRILEGRSVAEVRGADTVAAVVLDDGTIVPTDAVLVGIGVLARTEIAEAAGIACGDGILVDEYGRTSAPGVWAAGDCTRFTLEGASMRLESVPNAIDQAECAADDMTGRSRPYRPVPWFWSDQYDLKLQMVGRTKDVQETLHRRSERGESLWHFNGGTLVGVVAINDPGAYMAAKRMLEAGTAPAWADASAPDFDPLEWMRRASRKAA